MHGVNFASNTKLPHKPCQSTNLHPIHCGLFDNADTVSFVGRPFPLNSAYEHLSRIKQCGFNTIRFVTTWEAIEHEGPDIYDIEYADYVVKLLQIVEEVGGLYVFIDPHQDVWSRFSGGSGAPMWTFYAAGLEPTHFEETLGAKVHNLASDPQKFTKMVWTTNYHRLASCTMFTLFFSGNTFTPKAKIDGMNIQDYLQSHFINAFAFLMNHIKDRIPHVFKSCLLGVESMNEPNSGFYGFGDLNKYPTDQKLKLDETPTPIQAMRLGMGYPEQVDIYSLSIFGPTKIGTKWIDPKGVKAWVTTEDNKDKHYGFNRSPDWKLGECIFGQHGVWDTKSGDLILPDYFKVHPETGEYLDENKFINSTFLKFWFDFKTKMEEIDDEMFLIMQPPVLQIPPKIKNNPKYVNDKTIVALHYYDGMSLLFQKWSRIMNVDTLGIMRGRYLNPVFGLVLGESNIRKSIKQQLKEMAIESEKNVGSNIPVIFTETGMPFNMDNKSSYKDGDYSSQEAANDAILSGLENEQLNFTYWCYNPDNCHVWGDLWNLEDFSIWSRDDVDNLQLLNGNNYDDWLLKNSLNSNNQSYSPTEYDSDSNNSIESERSITKERIREVTHNYAESAISEDHSSKYSCSIDLMEGVRAVNAIVRPVPMLINGIVNVCEFDIAEKKFHLNITPERNGTENDIILIPSLYYQKNYFSVNVSGGSYKVKHNSLLQWIEWDHSNCNNHTLTLDVTCDDEFLNRSLYDRNSCKSSGLKELACGYL